MSLLSPEQSTFLNELRRRFLAKEPVSVEEMKRCIVLLRGSRTAATEAAAASKLGKSTTTRTKRAAPTAADVDAALADLENF